MVIKKWSNEKIVKVGRHSVRSLSVPASKIGKAQQHLSSLLPSHYTSPEMIAKTLENLGKPAVARLLKSKLPTNKISRSGDLGEIIATEAVRGYTDFEVPINRLRWKDHDDVAMRGEDLIGIKRPHGRHKMRFLKGEVKSRTRLTSTALKNARETLNRDDELPSSHALAFIMERLLEISQVDISNEIAEATLKDSIRQKQVTHMIFTFSGNNPYRILKTELSKYGGSIDQLSIGLHVDNHQKFIQNVYNAVIDDDEP